jgi:hypothetical protein
VNFNVKVTSSVRFSANDWNEPASVKYVMACDPAVTERALFAKVTPEPEYFSQLLPLLRSSFRSTVVWAAAV